MFLSNHAATRNTRISWPLLVTLGLLFILNPLTARADGDDDVDPVEPAAAVLKFVDPISLSAKPGVSFNVPLRSFLTDTTLTQTIAWRVENQPSWLEIQNDAFTGTPSISDSASGPVRFTLFAEMGSQTVNTLVTVTVVPLPSWAHTTIDLGITNEGQTDWSFNLNTVAKDPSGGALTFQAAGMPVWMRLDSASGVLTGSPDRNSVGHYGGITFTAVGAGGSATAQGQGDVRKVIHAPSFISKQITLTPDAQEGSEYTRDLIKDFVLNPEGTPILLQIVTEPPPPWLHVSTTASPTSGLLYGTPTKDNLGTKTITISLSTTIDGVPYTDDASFTLTVDHVNHAPYWLQKSFDLGQVYTGAAVDQSLGSSAQDPDMPVPGDTLTFKIVSFGGPGTNWATIDATTGEFKGSPQEQNIGANSWVVSVTDAGGLSDTTTVKIQVNKGLVAPHWNTKPTILPNGKQDKPYQVDLTGYATDSNIPPHAMTFTLLSGPSWLTINAQGVLSGTPGKDAVGINKLNVRVQNDIPGNDITQIQIYVDPTNHAPYWTMSPIQFTADENQTFTHDLTPWVVDPDGKTKADKSALVFSLVEGKAWAQLSPTGILTGTPPPSDEGANTFKVRVGNHGGLTADTTVVINVPHVDHAPYWTTHAQLPHAKEDAPYNVNVAQYAIHPDHKTLSFIKVSSAAAWLSISSDGTLTGTPRRKDVGDNSIDVSIEDPSHLTATTTFHIIVDKTLHPPYWRQTPLEMPDAWDLTPYHLSLSDFVGNPEGVTLTYAMVSGPKWMQVATDGTISGVPQTTDDGALPPTQFTVSDGTNPPVSVTAKGQVLHMHQPPIISPALPVFSMQERTLFKVSLNQPQYLSTSEKGVSLHCTFEEDYPPDWATLADNCDLSATPKFANIGTHQFHFKVSDGQAVTHGMLTLQVIRNPRPPVWITIPVTIPAKLNQPLTGTLNTPSTVVDLDGIALSFQKVSGPDWLTLAADGTLGGTPTDAALGVNAFQVKACNDKLCAQAGLNVVVQRSTTKVTIPVDKPVTGARAELLWVVDNGPGSEDLVRSLKANVHTFYEELSHAMINHRGTYLSADTQDAQRAGVPVQELGGPLVMNWNEGGIVGDFNRRTDLAYSDNALNSPIWSMWRFYERLAQMPGTYHATYFQPAVPMDVLLVTNERDHFKAYTAGSDLLKDHAASDFARDFGTFHTADRKRLRVNLIAPECPELIVGDAGTAAAVNAYQTIADASGGKNFTAGVCDFDMGNVLHQYAQQVVFRAEVSAKNLIPLDQAPKDPATIQVRIGGVAIAGNTGAAATDKWTYRDKPGPAIALRWDLIDDSHLKPGDNIEVEYEIP